MEQRPGRHWKHRNCVTAYHREQNFTDGKGDYMNPATQKGKILGFCAENGSITIREAFEKLHINSPSKRISELRASGYDVQSTVEKRINSDGDEVRFKRYFIKEVGATND